MLRGWEYEINILKANISPMLAFKILILRLKRSLHTLRVDTDA